MRVELYEGTPLLMNFVQDPVCSQNEYLVEGFTRATASNPAFSWAATCEEDIQFDFVDHGKLPAFGNMAWKSGKDRFGFVATGSISYTESGQIRGTAA